MGRPVVASKTVMGLALRLLRLLPPLSLSASLLPSRSKLSSSSGALPLAELSPCQVCRRRLPEKEPTLSTPLPRPMGRGRGETEAVVASGGGLLALEDDGEPSPLLLLLLLLVD